MPAPRSPGPPPSPAAQPGSTPPRTAVSGPRAAASSTLHLGTAPSAPSGAPCRPPRDSAVRPLRTKPPSTRPPTARCQRPGRDGGPGVGGPAAAPASGPARHAGLSRLSQRPVLGLLTLRGSPGPAPLPASVRWCNLQPCAPGSTVLCACHCPRSAYHDLECAFAGSFYVASSGKLFQRPKRVTLTDFSTQPPGVCRTPTTRQVPCGTLKMQDSKRGTLRTGRSCRTEPAIWWSDDKPTNKCVSHCDKCSGERGRESRGRGAPAAATRARMRRRSPNPKTPLEATAQAAARGGRLAAPASSRWGLVFPKLVPRLGLRTVISPGCEHRDSGSRWRGLVGRPLDQGQR